VSQIVVSLQNPVLTDVVIAFFLGSSLRLYFFFGTLYAIEALINGSYSVKYPPLGQLVEMTYLAPQGQYSHMHVYCVGERSVGTPLIVFEAGGGTGVVSWMPLVDKLSSEFRVCAYDRQGYGWSQSGPLPNSDDDTVVRLDMLLQKIHELPPYILVGHSIGGQLVRLYHDKFPNKTAGMIQVDSVPQYTWYTKWLNSTGSTQSVYDATSYLVRVADTIRALFPILPFLRGTTARNTMPAKYSEMSASLYDAKNWNNQYWDIVLEVQTFKDGSAKLEEEKLLIAGSLGDLPTMVIYAPGDNTGDWYREIHETQARASTIGILVECPSPCYHSLIWDHVDFMADNIRNFTTALSI